MPPPLSSSLKPILFSFELFGGTDSDRIHVGDTFMKLAPTVTSKQWIEFVNEHPGLLVIEKEEELDEDDDEEEEDDDDDYKPPHASYPDIFKSVLLLVLAKRILPDGCGVDAIVARGDAQHATTNDADAITPSTSTMSSWKFSKSSKPIMMDMHGHTWTKHR